MVSWAEQAKSCAVCLYPAPFDSQLASDLTPFDRTIGSNLQWAQKRGSDRQHAEMAVVYPLLWSLNGNLIEYSCGARTVLLLGLPRRINLSDLQ